MRQHRALFGFHTGCTAAPTAAELSQALPTHICLSSFKDTVTLQVIIDTEHDELEIKKNLKKKDKIIPVKKKVCCTFGSP